MNELDTFLLFNFFSFLGAKYVLGIIVFAVAFTVAMDVFLASGPMVPSRTFVSVLQLSAMLLSLTFIMFVIYKVYGRERFYFMPLAISAAIILFVTCVLVIVRTALSDGAGFHVVQVVLALVGSLAMGALFSALVKVAQGLISA